MRIFVAACSILVACGGPADDRVADLPEADGSSHELAAKGPPVFTGGLPEWLGRGVCPERRWGVTLIPIDADGAECSSCVNDGVTFEVEVENICEDDRELVLEDGCLGWLYKVRSEEEQATVGKGEAECDEAGLSSVTLSPGDVWSETVFLPERAADWDDGVYELQATTPVEVRRTAAFELVSE